MERSLPGSPLATGEDSITVDCEKELADGKLLSLRSEMVNIWLVVHNTQIFFSTDSDSVYMLFGSAGKEILSLQHLDSLQPPALLIDIELPIIRSCFLPRFPPLATAFTFLAETDDDDASASWLEV